MNKKNKFLSSNWHKKSKTIPLTFFIFTTIAIILLQPRYVYAKEISFGLKSGIAFSKVVSINKFYSDNQPEGYPKHNYPPGFYISLFGEKNISKRISIICEFYFIKTTSQITMPNWVEAIPKWKYYVSSLHLPVLLKYQTNWFIAPYLLAGVDMRYLIKAKYDFIDNQTKTFIITDELSPTNFSVIFGIGKKFKMFNKLFLWETKFMLDLTKQNPSKDVFLDSWKNNELMFGLGIIL